MSSGKIRTITLTWLYLQRSVKALKIAALGVFTLGFPFALWIGIRFMPATMQTEPVSTVELISILFVGITIVLGVLAIVIAVLAIWGYHAIKDESRRIAEDAARDAALAFIKSEDLQNRLREESRKIIDEEMIKVKEGDALAAAQPPQGTPGTPTQEDSQPVAKRYAQDKEGG
jgi:hypothetical protein